MLRRRLTQSRGAHLPDDEPALVAAAKSGSIESYNRLVLLHQRAVFNLSYRMMGTAAEAEDVTQDTFLKAWQAIHQFQEGSFRAWLMRIATNRSYDRLRALSRHPEDSLTLAEDDAEIEVVDNSRDADPVSLSERLDLSAALQAALDALPTDQRLAVILCDVMSHSYDEASVIAGVPAGTIKSRLSRGRERLRSTIREREEFRELVNERSRLTTGQGDGG